MAPRLGHRAVEHLAALGQQDDLITQALGVLHHMGGEDHRRAPDGKIADHPFQRLLVDRIQAAERLVEDHQFRLMDDGADQLDLLGHALG